MFDKLKIKYPRRIGIFLAAFVGTIALSNIKGCFTKPNYVSYQGIIGDYSIIYDENSSKNRLEAHNNKTGANYVFTDLLDRHSINLQERHNFDFLNDSLDEVDITTRTRTQKFLVKDSLTFDERGKFNSDIFREANLRYLTLRTDISKIMLEEEKANLRDYVQRNNSFRKTLDNF